MGLQNYLAFCVKALERLQDCRVVHVVLGNEACDLDSAVSAIVYAYFLHETSLAPLGTALFLPLLNIPRSDFPLCTEVVYLLGKLGISAADLIFRDDLDLVQVKVTAELKVTLVDQHVLSRTWMADLEENVVQIFDHRPKDGDLPDRCDSRLELVGSCSTLVAEALLTEETFTIDPVSAALLYGTIVTDTINFSAEAGKMTAKDLDIAERLEGVIGGGLDRDSLFNEIAAAKFDLSGLTVKEILQKDLKMVRGDSLTVAMCSVTMDMKALMEREGFADSLKAFAQEKQVDAAVLLTLCSSSSSSCSSSCSSCSPQGHLTRQLAVFSMSRVYRQQMAEVLSGSQCPNLGLSPMAAASSPEELLAFSQSNVKASRKQILPIVKAFLAGESTPDETQVDAYDGMPQARSEGFTSMSSIVGSRQNTSEGDISSEDLISRDSSTEEEEDLLLPTEEDDLLPLPADHKVFDPLSSVHSSDSGGGGGATSSPHDANRSAEGWDGEEGGRGLGNRLVAVDGSSEPTSTPTAQALPLPSPPPPLVNTSSSPPSPPHPGLDHRAGFSPNNNDNNNDNAASAPSGHNGPAQEGEDALQQDFLGMASPHDLLFPVDSPLDVSAATSGQVSGQTSGQASKAPSYPVTPPNSYMEDSIIDKEVQLPSFNSSEMVEKIQEKQAALGGGGGGGGSEGDPPSPFTPQNSYVDNSDALAKVTPLPSFHSADMVQRIRQKRSSMEREAGGEEEEEDGLLEVERSPFTPHNSYVEASLHTFAPHNLLLPSLNNAEIANKIRQKQAQLGGGGSGDSGRASPAGREEEEEEEGEDSRSPAAPYTPQNSFRDSSHLGGLQEVTDAHLTDMLEVAERLSLTGSESSGSLNEPRSVRASNRLHVQGSAPQQQPAAATTAVFPAGQTNASSEASSLVSSGTDLQGSEVAMETSSSPPSLGVKGKAVSFPHHHQHQDSEEEEEEDGAGAEEEEESIQKIAYELANEMIQRALETFPSESVKELVPEGASGGGGEREQQRPQTHHPSISEDSSPTMDDSDDQDMLSPCRFSPEEVKAWEAGTPDSALLSSTESDQFTAAAAAAHFSPPPPSAMKMSTSLADELAQAMSSGGGGVGGRGQQPRFSDGFASPEEDSEALGSEGVRKSASYEIETEYLCDMDPMQRMGVFHPEAATVIETDADKEVVEGASFRKVSGQEYQSVQEDILEQIRQEAKERETSELQRSSVAEEDDSEGVHLPAAADDDDDDDDDNDHDHNPEDTPNPTAGRKRIAPEADLNFDDSLTDEQGKRTLRVARDQELYASALENERAVIDVPEQLTLQPSDLSHPLLDTSSSSPHPPQTEAQPRRQRIEAPVGPAEDLHYESFVETGSLDNAAQEESALSERRRSERTGSVARTVSAASETSLKGVELCDEWQDDELPKMLGAEGQPLAGDLDSPEVAAAAAAAAAAEEGEINRKRLVPDQGLVEKGDNLENVEVVDSDSEIDSDIDNEQLEWENDTPVRPPVKQTTMEAEEIPQYTAAEERRDAQNWKMVKVGGEGVEFRLDMRVIEPYKRVLSHGGYCGEGLTAMIVFSACYLPSRDRRDYSYVMNHLFHYVLHTLDELVADDYMIVYFHGATPRRQMPSFGWLKRCYQGIDRRLKKNLKALYLVHPTLWLKTVVLMTRPFISAKFSSKLQFVRTLADLKQLIPMEYVYIPEIVQRYDNRHFHSLPPSSSSSSSMAPQ